MQRLPMLTTLMLSCLLVLSTSCTKDKTFSSSQEAQPGNNNNATQNEPQNDNSRGSSAQQGTEQSNDNGNQAVVDKEIRRGSLPTLDTAAFNSCALTTAGVQCWGLIYADTAVSRSEQAHPVTVMQNAADLVQIATSGYHTCALTAAGQVMCWGGNDGGQLGNGQSGLGKHSTTPVYVVAGKDSSTPLTGIVQIADGGRHTCALTAAGEVMCWGWGDRGELGFKLIDRWSGTTSNVPLTVKTADGKPLSNVVQVTAATRGYHSCALLATGKVMCWGNDSQGQLGDGKATDGWRNHVPVMVQNAKDIVQVDAGKYHTCALDEQGRALCWGRGESGRLGDGTTKDSSTAVKVVAAEGTTLPPFSYIAAGESHTCALDKSGQVWCWGEGDSGNLGDGKWGGHHKSLVPVLVQTNRKGDAPLTGIVHVSVGAAHTCALTEQGKVKCWGVGTFGQLGDGRSGAVISNLPTDVLTSAKTPLTAKQPRAAWACYDDGACKMKLLQDAAAQSP